jgi:glucose-6-phosphate 1-epimerase
MSPAAVFSPGVAIRGGVPVIFPQFGPGPLLRHGFARISPWNVIAQQPDCVALELRDSMQTRQHWPHAFALRLQVRIGGQRLEMQLEVENTDTQPFSFTGSLHTYLAVEEADAATVQGLSGLQFTNSPDGTRHTDSEPEICFGAEIDRAYHAAEARCARLGDCALTQTGFQDTVVWNPGPAVSQGIKDLPQPDGWRHFVCVEATQCEKPVTLAPGEKWRGASVLEAIG